MTEQAMLTGMPAPGPVIKRPRGWAADLDHRSVQQIINDAGWHGIVLPYTEVSVYQGFPVIRWIDGARERLRFGPGPVLIPSILALWERWPLGVSTLPPPTPLQIVGFVSVATWRPAFKAVCALAGMGSGMIITPRRPSVLRLSAADYAGIHVVHYADRQSEVLVTGRTGPVATARRTTNTRYREECLFGHALTHWRQVTIAPGVLPGHSLKNDPQP